MKPLICKNCHGLFAKLYYEIDWLDGSPKKEDGLFCIKCVCNYSEETSWYEEIDV